MSKSTFRIPEFQQLPLINHNYHTLQTEIISKMKQLISPLALKIKNHFSKHNIKTNSNLIYNMNKYLQFPSSFLYSEFSQSPELINKALKEVDIIQFVDNKKLKLIYPGSHKIVLVKGIKKQIMDKKIKQFLETEKIKIIKSSIKNGDCSFQMFNQQGATILKKFLRQNKKLFDIRGDQSYKVNISIKVRIVIEGEEHYTLLLDELFQREQTGFLFRNIFFDAQRKNTQEGIMYQPIIGHQNYMDTNRRDDSDEELSDITSKCSQGNSMRQMNQLVETNETGTQLNEVIAEQAVLRNELSPEKTEDNIFQCCQEVLIREEDEPFQQTRRSKGASVIQLQSTKKKLQRLSSDNLQEYTEEVRDKNNSIINPPFSFCDEAKGSSQKYKQSSEVNVYLYETIVGLYQDLLDKGCLFQPQIFNKYPQILAKNANRQKFLDFVHKKISKGKYGDPFSK